MPPSSQGPCFLQVNKNLVWSHFKGRLICKRKSRLKGRSGRLEVSKMEKEKTSSEINVQNRRKENGPVDTLFCALVVIPF